MTDEARTLGATIRRLRLAQGMTQEVFAERVGDGMRQPDVSGLEKGRVELPRRPRLERIARVLGMTAGELLALSGWARADDYLNGEDEPDPATLRTTAHRLLDELPDAALAYTVDTLERIIRSELAAHRG